MAGRIRPAACKLPTLDIKPPRNHKCTRDISPPGWEPHRIKWKRRKQRRSTSVTTVTTPQEFAGEHPRPVSSLLKGLIWQKNKTARGINEKSKLSSAATENRACKSTLCIGFTPSECSLSTRSGILPLNVVSVEGLVLAHQKPQLPRSYNIIFVRKNK